METKTPHFPAARRAFRGSAPARLALFAVALGLLALPGVAPAAAPGAAGATVTVKGKTVGAGKLLNPGWNEAKDPNLHRFTFREPSATVRSDVRNLTAFLPKELCVVALIDGDAQPLGAPMRMVVAGGRTTPVTLVVAKGQQIQFENQDPFVHKLYVAGSDSKGFAPVETAPARTRGWTPPGPGKYEIRDQASPSVRSWIVVEPHAANVGYPDRKGEFQIELAKGNYKLRGYFNGEPIGTALDILVAPLPAEQPLKLPLILGEAGPGEAPAAPPGKPGKAPAPGGGG
jgi:hypothetical protein